MKKTWNIVYIAICLFACVLPFAGMAVYRTETTTENKILAVFPSWEKDGSFNKDYFDEISAYFEDHFAFRQELVSIDAEIQSKVFQVSNVDTVLVGKNGWLYYTDTLNDYLRQDIMTERQVFNTVHNLSLLQQYVTEKGADFLFTVAPNKNSLYEDNMPYYADCKAGDVKNIDMLKPKFAEAEISYVDLFEPFEKEGETLYLKKDSHWNNKGAVLVYDTILDSLMIEHNTYEGVKAFREEAEYGDLNKMLYPLTARPEWNYYYQYENSWSYVSEDQDVEAAWIETQCPEGAGSLLMFRDSFGNTLLPLMAEQFEKAFFSKGIPYRIAEYMEQCNPEFVIVEKVERNLDEYMLAPPIMPGPEAALGSIKEDGSNVGATVEIEESIEDTNYWIVSGDVEGADLGTDAKIYIRLVNGGASKSYEAFTTTTEHSDFGYILYLPKKELQSTGLVNEGRVIVDVIIEGEDGLRLAKTRELTLEIQ